MLDIHFTLRIARECESGVRDDGVLDVCFDFFAVEVFFRAVPCAEVVYEWADGFSL